MKTFETPKVIELGTLQEIVLSGPAGLPQSDISAPHSSTIEGS